MDIGGEFIAVASVCFITISATDAIVAFIGVVTTIGIIELFDSTLSESQFYFSKERSKRDVDPYARQNQKKQGRENKNKNRQKSNYTPRNNRRDGKPAPPKHHTPGKDHQKFSQSRSAKQNMLYKRIG